MQHSMQQFLHWMQTSPIGRDEMEAQNNHGTWYDAVRMAINLYTGDTAGARIVAANAMTSIIHDLGELDYDYLDPIVSVSAPPFPGLCNN